MCKNSKINKSIIFKIFRQPQPPPYASTVRGVKSIASIKPNTVSMHTTNARNFTAYQFSHSNAVPDLLRETRSASSERGWRKTLFLNFIKQLLIDWKRESHCNKTLKFWTMMKRNWNMKNYIKKYYLSFSIFLPITWPLNSRAQPFISKLARNLCSKMRSFFHWELLYLRSPFQFVVYIHLM